MKDIAKAFERFHRDNPHVYDLVRRFALEAAESGRRKLGIALIFERIRWHVQFEGGSAEGEDFKLNNNYRAFYARMFIRDFPQYSDLFELRPSVADHEIGVAA